MLSDVGIINVLNKSGRANDCKIKQKVEDFIVQEVVNGVDCKITPIIDLDKYRLSQIIFDNLPKDLDKAGRKSIYETANFNVFKRLITKDGQLSIKTDDTDDIFVFTVVKYNCSSNYLISLLSRRLEVPPICIQPAGTKDKRGITFQEISVKCSASKLLSYAFSLQSNNLMNLSDFGYDLSIDSTNKEILAEASKYINISPIDVTENIRICNVRRGAVKKLGDLDGNRFTILIRGLKEIKIVPKIFINYYGQQRFGINFNNHIIGEKILNKRYDEVLDLILEDNPHSSEEAKDYDKEKNLSYLQRYILKMKEKENSNKFIVNSFARNIKMTYLHAYQSFKFNLAINKRLEFFKIEPGDKIDEGHGLIDAKPGSELSEIFMPLEKMDDKLLKGGYRKILEAFHDFQYTITENGIRVSFFLKKSSYATMALRELLEDYAYEE